MGTLSSSTPTTTDILSFLRRPEGPTVSAIAVTSIDGRGAIDGASGGLGNDTDATIFNTLRALSDAVFVGTGTIVAENYGPVEIPADLQKVRHDLGRQDHVVMATLSRSLDLDVDSDFFSDAHSNSPIIFTPNENSFEDEEEAATHVAKIKKMESAGATVVKLAEPTPAAALTWLKDNGYRDIVVEGGPTMYRAAIESGSVDELFVTLSPTWVGHGPLTFGDAEPDETSDPQRFKLRDMLRSDSHIFLRYSRSLTH
jgi:riboflavin biosynthesis pyrimidine reductase